MRRLVATGLVATLGMLAAPASASFDHRFTVLDKNTSFHETPYGFRQSGRLVDPREPVRRGPVGHQQTKCRARPDDSAKCRGVAQLSGEVGGSGEIKFRGKVSLEDFEIRVVGGSGDFEGVEGKIVFHGVNKNTTRWRVRLR